MDNQQLSKMINANALFDHDLMDGKALYLHCFDELPNISFVGNIDGEKAYAAFVERDHGQTSVWRVFRIQPVEYFRWTSGRLLEYPADLHLQ
ncbi:MAG TPA: hypothetical protein VHC48_17835 [Puia sp.]|jgi:hypothetical protein|nr:hypothetical protein [Puia sp.]